MAGAKFDNKTFNPQAFGAYVENVPNLTRNALINSGAIRGNANIRNAFSNQTGTAYAILPMFDNIGGEAQNYDGTTDLTSNSTKTYEQGVVVIGRANAWSEYDFSEDITGGVDFMSNVGSQVSKYWETVDQKMLLSILKGIFAMTGTENLKFVDNHTWDISTENGENAKVGATTLNSAIQRASGDNKNAFTLVIMHSAVATNLENLNLLSYLKQTDANGIQRDLTLATWNGRTVLIDDNMPVDTSGGENKYTTYILGQGAFYYENIGAKVPYEMGRDPKIKGGQDTLYSRQRKCFAPYGISYTKKNQATNSPTNAELEDGSNWELVNTGGAAGVEYIDVKAIPIARIVSKG